MSKEEEMDGRIALIGLIAVLIATAVSATQTILSMENDSEGKREYIPLIEEIDKTIVADNFSALESATKRFDKQVPVAHSSQAKIYRSIYAAEALAKGLVAAYNTNMPPGYTERSRFDKLYIAYVEEPCKKVIELKEKLDNLIAKHADDLNNYKFKTTYVPGSFTKMAKICLSPISQRRTYVEFMRAMKN